MIVALLVFLGAFAVLGAYAVYLSAVAAAWGRVAASARAVEHAARNARRP